MFKNISKNFKNISKNFKNISKIFQKISKISKNLKKKSKKIQKNSSKKCKKNISKMRRRRFWMTKNHFNGKKSIFQVFLVYAVKYSKNFPDQDHTVANLLRSDIKYFRDVPQFSSYLTRYIYSFLIF